MAGGCAAGEHGRGLIEVQGRGFVIRAHGEVVAFTPWGFNYDRTVVGGKDMLLEDVVRQCPEIIDEDFAAMQRLGGNVVRVFIGTADMLSDAEHVDPSGLVRLERVLKAADAAGIRLIVVGLATLRPATIPAWMVSASDEQMEAADVLFWRAVAKHCRGRSAVFAYDLQNEPVIYWENGEKWIEGCFAMPDGQEFCYVHRRYRRIRARWTQHVQATYGDEQGLRRHWADYPRAGESWENIATPPFDNKDSRFGEYLAWQIQLTKSRARQLVEAIRGEDATHPVTVGALDPAPMAEAVDFMCYHLYPRPVAAGEDFLAVNEREWRAKMASLPADKPLVIEEFYPMWAPASIARADVLAAMLRATRERCAGWVSFYWGPAERLARGKAASQHEYQAWLDGWSKGPQGARAGE